MRQIRHTGIIVNDLEKMKDFYCRNFGMEVVYHQEEGGDYLSTLVGAPGIVEDIYKLRCTDGTMVELLKPNQNADKDVHADSLTYQGCLHLAFTVCNLEQLYQTLLNEGIEFISPPLASPAGNVHVCFCRDPEGNYLELVEDLS